MSARRWLRGGRWIAAFAVMVSPPVGVSPVHATPSRWALARDPIVRRDERAIAAAERASVEGLSGPSPFDDVALPAEILAARALDALRAAGGEESSSPWVRLHTARALTSLGRFEAAATVLESVVRSPALPLSVRSDAWGDLAIAYARLDRVPEEIEAYEEAIAREPHAASRATMIANQAEAFMVAADLPRAVAGYRSALAELSTLDAQGLAPTTLWSLAVATDRSGDLDAALELVERARAYDPFDVRLQSPGWFFVPPYDRHWYEALGHWLVARGRLGLLRARTSRPSLPGLVGPQGVGRDELEVRRDAYERGVLAWRLYLAAAPADGPYLAIAKARLSAMQAEQAQLESEATGPKRPPSKTTGR
jgi:tetratricopeptide (TPR) repeat protein